MDNFERFLRLASRVESDPAKIQAGWTHLHVAVHSNHREAVEFFLDDGDDITATDLNGETALHVAALSADRDEVACTLLERCTRERVRRLLDARSHDRGWTALHVAAANDAFSIVSLLLGFGANFEARDKADKRPIDVAKEPMVRKLLDDVEVDWRFAESSFKALQTRFRARSSFELDASICSRNVDGRTMLQAMIIKGDAEAIERMVELRLLRHKVDPPIQLVRSAVRFGECAENVKMSYKALSRLCDEEVSLQPRRTLEEGTRLLKAAMEATRCYRDDQMHLAVVEETLEALQFGEEEDEDARFHRALSTDRKSDLISFLDTLQITILAPIFMLLKLICTVYLGAAAQKNDLSAIERCLSGGPSDVNIQDLNGWTPLHHAVHNGNEAMVRRLLESRADAKLVTKKNGKTPLHMAVKSGSAGIVEVLVNCKNFGEYVDVKCGPKGFTALHIAAKMGELDVVKLLLGKGANFRTVDEKGKLAVDLAKDTKVRGFLKLVSEVFEKAEKGEDDIVQKLESLMSDEVIVFMNARNHVGCNLLSVVKKNFNNDILSRVQAILNKAVESTKKI